MLRNSFLNAIYTLDTQWEESFFFILYVVCAINFHNKKNIYSLIDERNWSFTSDLNFYKITKIFSFFSSIFFLFTNKKSYFLCTKFNAPHDEITLKFTFYFIFICFHRNDKNIEFTNHQRATRFDSKLNFFSFNFFSRRIEFSL